VLFFTISRQTGSLGEEITEHLAKKMDMQVLTKEMVLRQWFPEIASKHQLSMLQESPSFYLNPSSAGVTFAAYLENRLKEYVAKEPAIICGLGSQLIFADHPDALHVKIMASPQVRVDRIMASHHLVQKDAERFLEISDRKHKRYISTLFGRDWSDPLLYHLILNTDFFRSDEAASLLAELAAGRLAAQAATQAATKAAADDAAALLATAKNKKQTENQNAPITATHKNIVFKHPSEEEFASLLDMYGLDWQYEPRTFPIKWDAEGNITLAFSPDFYLPKFDTYIELTTMNQKYTAQKKKKVALLQTLYPGTNINIVFKSDFHTLIRRFGLRRG